MECDQKRKQTWTKNKYGLKKKKKENIDGSSVKYPAETEVMVSPLCLMCGKT